MRKTVAAMLIIASASTVIVGSREVNAQASHSCNQIATSGSVLDACIKSLDLFRFISPQVGVVLAGGSPMPGEAGALGGIGKLSVQLRVTVVAGNAPSQTPDVRGGVAPVSNFGSQSAPFALPSLDVAAGLFKGLPVGLTNIGGVDLLLGVSAVPNFNAEALTLETPGGPLALSYGVRVGVFQESAAVPGIDLSYRVRNLATTQLAYSRAGDSLSTEDARSTAHSFRLTAGKHFSIFGVAAGFGRDRIASEAAFRLRVVEGATVFSGTLPLTKQNVSKSNAFVNFSFGVASAQVILETGRSFKGSKQEIYNTFGSHSANEAYQYFSIGAGFRPF